MDQSGSAAPQCHALQDPGRTDCYKSAHSVVLQTPMVGLRTANVQIGSNLLVPGPNPGPPGGPDWGMAWRLQRMLQNVLHQ